jgi:glycine cleavage system H protein
MNIPSNLKFTKSEEWVLVEGNIATIGITDYAQDQLSDIVYIEYLVDVDDEIKGDSVIATLESVKAAADVNIPVGGTVLEINESLADTHEMINTEAFNAWMVKIEMNDLSGLDALMDADAYKVFSENREH